MSENDAAKLIIYRLRQMALNGPLAYDAIAADEAAELIEALLARAEKAEEERDAYELTGVQSLLTKEVAEVAQAAWEEAVREGLQQQLPVWSSLFPMRYALKAAIARIQSPA